MDKDAIKAWDALPLEQRRAHTAASNGLLDGDLAPLARYIRAGWPIDEVLAEQIADAIEGPDEEGYTLRMVNRRGHRTFSERESTARKSTDIALFVRSLQIDQVRAGRAGGYDGIVQEAQDRFGVTRSTVTKAVADLRRELGDEIWFSSSGVKPEGSD